jgi:hypothetical protein
VVFPKKGDWGLCNTCVTLRFEKRALKTYAEREAWQKRKSLHSLLHRREREDFQARRLESAQSARRRVLLLFDYTRSTQLPHCRPNISALSRLDFLPFHHPGALTLFTRERLTRAEIHIGGLINYGTQERWLFFHSQAVKKVDVACLDKDSATYIYICLYFSGSRHHMHARVPRGSRYAVDLRARRCRAMGPGVV